MLASAANVPSVACRCSTYAPILLKLAVVEAALLLVKFTVPLAGADSTLQVTVTEEPAGSHHRTRWRSRPLRPAPAAAGMAG